MKSVLYSLRRIIPALLVLFSTAYSAHTQSMPFPASDDEFVGPFTSWINVKTQFGARGDSLTDETAALQAAFDAIGNSNSTSSVVYLPPGIYRITGKLTMNYKMSVSVIGADPSNTIIKWDGAANGTMMQVSGTAYSRFNRITWNGNSKAAVAIEQSYNGSQGYFDTGNEYADNIFTDVGTGIKGGFLGYGFAETAIMRSKFIRNTVAGVSIGNFNALDIWVWNCVFQNCNIGVTNIFGAGNFQVYNSIFRNSTTSDIYIDNTGTFSFRENTSTNSKAFLITTLKRYAALIILQGNTIIDPVSSIAINIRNHGPVTLIDNVIRSRAGAAAPVISHVSDPSSDFFSMGNTFTVAGAIQTTSRKIVYDNAVVTRESLADVQEPLIPGPQPNLNRQVFEVPLGAGRAVIQNAINQAALVNGSRPVIHLPFGTYFIDATLKIPAGTDMQIIGDGDGDMLATWLVWQGTSTGPVISIEGPSKATLRDFSINGSNTGTSVQLTNIDQPGSRFYMYEVEAHLNQSNLLVNGLDNTLVLARNSRFSKAPQKSIIVTGGPMAAAGNPQQGKTIISAGLEFDNFISHEVTNGGNLLVRDVWYESSHNGPYLNLPGTATFTVEGSRLASPANTELPYMNLSNFAGKATFLNIHLDDRIAVNGTKSQTQLLGLGILSQGSSYIANDSTPGGDIRSLNCRIVQDANSVVPRSGSRTAANIGVPDSLFIASMLAPIRNTHSGVLTSLPAGVTDVRMLRVWSFMGGKGIELKGNEATSLSQVTFSGKVYLQGAFNTDSGKMNNILNRSRILQSFAGSQPYQTLFNYSGTESVGSNFFTAHPDVVDWVLVELRNATSVLATRAAFVKQDGTLVDTNGIANFITFQNITPGNYYVAIRHRNHLPIRSSATADFSSGTANYDFTTAAGKCYQNQSYTSTVQTGNVWTMRGGNANADNTVKYNGPSNDQDNILNMKLAGSASAVLNNQYATEDINMDGIIKANGPGNDQNFLLNIILSGLIGNVINAQL